MSDATKPRIPPGQIQTTKWPVLHYGDVPSVETSKWTFMVSGRAKVKPEAKYCLVVAEQGFTTNLPLSDLNRPENLIALKWAGEPLMPEHGWPARLLVPHLYFWKSAKWVRGFELLEEDLPGFWEQNGYHMHGDPWTEERYGGRGLSQHEINKFRNASKRIGGTNR